MPIGPAMILGGLGILALATMGKKSSAAPALPSGEPGNSPALPPGSSVTRVPTPSTQRPVDTTGFVKPSGPVPVLLPAELAELMAKSLKDLTVTESGSIVGPVTADAVQRATTVAAQIESAGFPDAASAFRAWIQLAAKKVPAPTPDKRVTIPGVSPAIVDQVNRALQLERDPNKLRSILTALQNLPKSPQRDNLIEMLTETIKQVEAAIVMAETLKKTEQVLQNPGPPPAVTAPAPVIELPPMTIPASAPAPQPQPQPRPQAPVSEVADTPEARRAVNLANHLVNRILDNGTVTAAKGKEDKSLVKAFQLAEGATSAQADGLAGPGTMLKLAKYQGALPLVYYWPKSATAKNVNDYRSTLRQMADVHEQNGRPGIAAKLRDAATRERGQGGIVGAMPA